MKNTETTIRLTKNPIALFLSAVFALLAANANASIVLQDSFDDGDRTANPAWYLVKKESSATVVNDATLGGGNAMQFDNQHAGSNASDAPWTQKGVAASFSDTTLNTGETLKLSFDFRLLTATTQTGELRFGLAYDGGTAFTQDGTANGSSAGDDDYSYFVGLSSGANTDLAIREDNGTSSGFLAGGDVVANKASGSFTLNDTLKHTLVMEVTKTSDTLVDLSVTLDGTTTLTGQDTSNLKTLFNEVGLVSTNRDLDFMVDNLQVEVIPEPATLGIVTAAGIGIIAIRRRFMM